jgi:ribonuclease P protein component
MSTSLTAQLDRHKFRSCHRLLSSSEFDHVFKANQYRVGGSEFLILAVQNEQPYSRVGMVIGKKNTQLAVNRNTIKRLIRESFRHHTISEIGLDIVIVSRKGVNRCSKTELRVVLQKLWLNLSGKSSASVNEKLLQTHTGASDD